MGKPENVVIKEFGQVTQVDDQWPSGDLLIGALAEEKLPPERMGDPKYWQTSVRWSLLRKYGYDEIPTEEEAYQIFQGARRLVFTDDQIEAIQKKWATVFAMARAQPAKNDDDLLDFLCHSRSRDRGLQWALMECKAGTQFNLHAHPNLEVAHCVRGALHEIRMKGEPWDQGYEPRPEDPSKVKGPNLTQSDRSWYFDTLNAGEWLINEAGSIHKSFTATSGDGCLLLVLWSGSHADVVTDEMPKKVNVQKALDTMDNRLSQCDCTEWHTLSETFLPESEKKSSKD